MSEKSSALVLGCGVIGLSSALRLQEAGYSVTIWTRDLPPQTTSNIAAAIWYPYKIAPLERVKEWSRRGYEVFRELAVQPRTGVIMLRGLDLFGEGVLAEDILPDWAGYVQGFRQAVPAELPSGYARGYYFEAPQIEMRLYLQYLIERFEAGGGQILQREVKSLEETGQEASLVVNCTGLGSQTLLDDHQLYPIRGQLVRVARPALNAFRLADDVASTTYIVPRSTDCILGGTAIEGDWSLEPRPVTAVDITNRCAILEPEVAHLPVLEHLVGLRPGRPSVRLESERLPGGAQVIHNYGHGGAGVTVSWGCAEEVVSLAKALSE